MVFKCLNGDKHYTCVIEYSPGNKEYCHNFGKINDNILSQYLLSVLGDSGVLVKRVLFSSFSTENIFVAEF